MGQLEEAMKNLALRQGNVVVNTFMSYTVSPEGKMQVLSFKSWPTAPKPVVKEEPLVPDFNIESGELYL